MKRNGVTFNGFGHGPALQVNISIVSVNGIMSVECKSRLENFPSNLL